MGIEISTGLKFIAYNDRYYKTVEKAHGEIPNGIKLRKSHITEMWCGIFLKKLMEKYYELLYV